MKKTNFFSNFGSILALGVGGTVLTFSAVSAAVFYVLPLAGLLRLPPRDALALGAIFAASDSVAVLAMLSQEEHPVLFATVFGESILNDATSLVLLTASSSATAGAGGTGAGVGPVGMAGLAWASAQLLGSFAYQFLLSLLLGVAAGLACSALLRRLAPQAEWRSVRP